VAYIHFELKQFGEADKCYDQILKMDPNHVASLDWKGIIAGMKGDYKEAISYFDKALQIDPQNKRVQARFSNCPLLSYFD
jgi:tetratricopeptide (TPR) repeat protein